MSIDILNFQFDIYFLVSDLTSISGLTQALSRQTGNKYIVVRSDATLHLGLVYLLKGKVATSQ